ncbi:toprim domain-containing protein, partial [Paenibacillus glucanolyticus]
YHNAIFVGFDLQGTPRYAAIRGTTNTRYLGEAPGSDKRYSFAIPADDNGTELHLFESAIDLLSYCTLETIAGKDWRQSHQLSLAGIYSAKESIAPAALTNYLQSYPEVKRLVFHLDNDEPGRSAAAMIRQLFSQTYEISDEPPFVKDVNDDLMVYRKQREEPTR